MGWRQHFSIFTVIKGGSRRTFFWEIFKTSGTQYTQIQKHLALAYFDFDFLVVGTLRIMGDFPPPPLQIRPCYLYLYLYLLTQIDLLIRIYLINGLFFIQSEKYIRISPEILSDVVQVQNKNNNLAIFRYFGGWIHYFKFLMAKCEQKYNKRKWLSENHCEIPTYGKVCWVCKGEGTPLPCIHRRQGIVNKCSLYRLCCSQRCCCIKGEGSSAHISLLFSEKAL